MPRATLAAAALLAAALPLNALAPAPASAAPLDGREIQARSAGGEFRGYGSTRRGSLEDMIWRLQPDGTLRSVSQVLRKYGGGMGAEQLAEYGDAGTWHVDGNRLCVQFRSVHADLSGCYTVETGTSNQVRLAGPVQLQGTLAR